MKDARFRLVPETADTRGHGLGDILKRTLEQQVDEVVDVFGLKSRPGTESVFNRSMLPPMSERLYSA